jgi:DNA-binding CsgD family transcriptional regulator
LHSDNSDMRFSLEELSAAIAAIHAAAASPERWSDAFAAVARLVNGSHAVRDLDRAVKTVLGSDPNGDPQVHAECEPSVKRLKALLAPHFETAKRVQTRLAEVLPGRLALASLERLALAAFIVDRSGAVHHLNASARALLAEARSVRISSSRIRFGDAKLNGAFDAALRKATEPLSGSSLLPLSLSERELYEVAVSPLETDQPRLPHCLMPLALVVITRLRPDATCIAQRVRGLYGLTAAEARVMSALALGGTVEDIAAARRVRSSTVRAQIRSIFAKTGVNRQSDLVRLALMGAPIAADSALAAYAVSRRDQRSLGTGWLNGGSPA